MLREEKPDDGATTGAAPRPEDRSSSGPTEKRERPSGREPLEPERRDENGADRPSGAGRARDAADPKPSGRSKLGTIRAHPIWTALIAVGSLVAVVAGVLWYLEARHWESTDDAFVDGRSFTVAPKVPGYVTEVLVTDNRHVEAGQVIARIDTRDYDVALRQAEAQLASAQASLQSSVAQIASGRAQVEEARAQVRQSEATLSFAADESTRATELVQKGAGTLQRAQQTTSQLREGEAALTRSKAAVNSAERQVNVLEAQRGAAEASVAQAGAQVAQATLNLSYTTLMAVQPGRIVRLTGARGQLAQAGQAIAMFVPDELWLTANFKETQLTDMRPGQAVDVTIDAYPGRKLTGHVDSVQPGSGTVFSLLPAQNATGNYVKVVQRVPVKIVFDAVPSDVTIGPGMSVVPRVRVR